MRTIMYYQKDETVKLKKHVLLNCSLLLLDSEKLLWRHNFFSSFFYIISKIVEMHQ